MFLFQFLHTAEPSFPNNGTVFFKWSVKRLGLTSVSWCNLLNAATSVARGYNWRAASTWCPYPQAGPIKKHDYPNLSLLIICSVVQLASVSFYRSVICIQSPWSWFRFEPRWEGRLLILTEIKGYLYVGPCVCLCVCVLVSQHALTALVLMDGVFRCKVNRSPARASCRSLSLQIAKWALFCCGFFLLVYKSKVLSLRCRLLFTAYISLLVCFALPLIGSQCLKHLKKKKKKSLAVSL